MYKSLLTILMLFVSFQVNAQVSTLLSSNRFLIYTPVTDTAINITSSSATIRGYNTTVKSNKQDTLATKKSVQNWMVIVGVDSLQGTTANFTGLTDSTDYTYYHSVFVKANDGDLDYYKGVNKTFLTDVAPVPPSAFYLINKSGGKILFKGNTYAIKFKD